MEDTNQMQSWAKIRQKLIVLFLILHAAFEIKAGEILKYLYVRICQFGKNFNNKIMANFAGAIMIWKAQRSHNLTELDFFTEFLWLYLTNHDKEHGYIVIHQLKTLPKSSEELLEHGKGIQVWETGF